MRVPATLDRKAGDPAFDRFVERPGVYITSKRLRAEGLFDIPRSLQVYKEYLRRVGKHTKRTYVGLFGASPRDSVSVLGASV